MASACEEDRPSSSSSSSSSDEGEPALAGHRTGQKDRPALAAAAQSRLGPCEFCHRASAVYTCPQCEQKSCSLLCVRGHKAETGCRGQRKRTHYVGLDKFTDLDLLSDYRLLEDLTRNVELLNQDEQAKQTRKGENAIQLSKRHKILLQHSKKRGGMRLHFVPPHFRRHHHNTSRYDVRAKQIVWKLEIVFPHAKQTVVNENVYEKTRLYELLSPYLTSEEGGELTDDPFRDYKSSGFGRTTVLLKSEIVQQDTSRFFELDVKKSLRANLWGRKILEFPVIFVIFESHSSYFMTESFLSADQKPAPEKSREAEKTSPPDTNKPAPTPYPYNWDWSDYRQTTVASSSGGHGKSETEAGFGLFSGAAADSDSDEDGATPQVKRAKLNNSQGSLLQNERENKVQKIVEQQTQYWRHAAQNHDDNSFISSYVNDGEGTGQGAGPEAQEDAVPKPGEDNYNQYYDFYLKYYKGKYGIKEVAGQSDQRTGREVAQNEGGVATPGHQGGVEAEAAKAKEEKTKPEVKPVVAKAKPAGLSALVSYGDSDSD